MIAEHCAVLKVTALKDNEDIVEPLSERIVGRVTVHDIYDPLTEELICEANQEITDELAKQIEDTNIEEVEIRSLLTCESRVGGCAKCYGRNLANW